AVVFIMLLASTRCVRSFCHPAIGVAETRPTRPRWDGWDAFSSHLCANGENCRSAFVVIFIMLWTPGDAAVSTLSGFSLVGFAFDVVRSINAEQFSHEIDQSFLDD